MQRGALQQKGRLFRSLCDTYRKGGNKLSRPVYYGEKTARRVALALLIICMPLFIRATNSVPEDARLTAQETQPPAATDVIVDLTPSPTETPLPTEEPIEDVVFVSQVATNEPISMEPIPLDVTAAPTENPEDKGWEYVTSAIEVYVTRHKQDDFVYFVADIQLTRPEQLWYAFSNEKFGGNEEALSDIAERHDPLLAINADYYVSHNNGIIIRGRELFRRQKSARHLLAVEANGDLTVMTDRSEKATTVASELVARGVLHTFEFGPVLVENGEAIELNSRILRVEKGYLEPRTAIGQIGPLHYIVIVVDGRSEGYSAGCDLPTLQQLFMDQGVDIAFNLDGGGSTTLWFNGEVINRPASGSERKISDILMFMRE